MIFETKKEKTDYKPTNNPKTSIRIDLEPQRTNNIRIIQKVMLNEVLTNKEFGYTKILKMALDKLINDLNKQDSEEKQLLYLRELYKEAIL